MRAAAANGARKIRAFWLKRIRIDRGLTQGKLAEKIGVSTTAISQYEKGIIEPSPSTLDRLLIVLECWWGDLLADSAVPPPPRRRMDRPTHDVNERSIQIVIEEFAHPSRPPKLYPDMMRCWICHGRPGECRCYFICKVCGLLVVHGKQCSGVLHDLAFTLAALPEIIC